jgi:hypothetical protein
LVIGDDGSQAGAAREFPNAPSRHNGAALHLAAS